MSGFLLALQSQVRIIKQVCTTCERGASIACCIRESMAGSRIRSKLSSLSCKACNKEVYAAIHILLENKVACTQALKECLQS